MNIDTTKITALDVAAYFLHKADADDAGDLISNLKLQKLLYYAQGSFLAVTKHPLFEDEIEAWFHGPVVPNVYQAYKQHKNKPIPAPSDSDYAASFKKFDSKQLELLDEVYTVFGQYSAWRLRDMTHQEAPWKEHENNVECTPTITHTSIKRYFETHLVNE